jgi:hypothetical protein
MTSITDSSASILSWYGGNMPTNPVQSAAAVKDMDAWSAAGKPNN